MKKWKVWSDFKYETGKRTEGEICLFVLAEKYDLPTIFNRGIEYSNWNSDFNRNNNKMLHELG